MFENGLKDIIYRLRYVDYDKETPSVPPSVYENTQNDKKCKKSKWPELFLD